MVAAEVPGANVAEFRGFSPATSLVGFQFFGVAEASYVTNLHFLTCLDGRNVSERGT